MPDRLKDKVALIVGAGSSGPGWGNGKCTAVTFAREGAKVMCVDLKRAAAEAAVGLAIVIMLAQNRQSLNVERINLLKL